MASTEGTENIGPEHAITRCADKVHGALDAASSSQTWSMSAAEQRTALLELTRAQARLCELRLRVLAGADTNDIGKATGDPSTAAWLARKTCQTRPRASSDLRLAGELDKAFEATRTALGDARVNEDQARVIVAAINDLPDDVSAFDKGRAEAHLIAEAADNDAKDLRALGSKLFEVLDPEQADERLGKKLQKEEDEARRKTWFKMHDNGDGTHTGHFKIPKLHAELLTKALHAFTAPRHTGAEARTAADGTKVPYTTLLGQAFTELVEHLPSGKIPFAGGNNATILVLIELDKLLAGIGAATLDTGGTISAGEARRLACEAGIIPVVLGGDSMPLDVGREQRFHTKSQRIAFAVRDKTCTGEHCDRPPGWCECHHDEPWSEGGQTNVETGRLLCPWHHHLAHNDAFSMRHLPNGQVRFRRRQ